MEFKIEYSDNGIPNAMLCPLVDKVIEDIDCMENVECIKDGGEIVPEALPEKYKQKKNYKEICKNCKWHNL